MKKSTLLALFFFLLFLSGCGKDGNRGDAFLSLDWDWYVDGYNDNNPQMPSAVSCNFDYPTGTGTFQYEYICSDGSGNFWFWEYTYTIKKNDGEKGKLFSKGEDGKDRYHNMFLHGFSTPSFSVNEKSITKIKKEELKPFKMNMQDFKKVYHGDPIFEQQVANGYITHIKKQMFTLE